MAREQVRRLPNLPASFVVSPRLMSGVSSQLTTFNPAQKAATTALTTWSIAAQPAINTNTITGPLPLILRPCGTPEMNPWSGIFLSLTTACYIR